MDEVDGMAGNEDRGGIQELINLIKNTSIPIVCMCNDRNHQKMRSLVNYCFDLRFGKPKPQQIMVRQMLFSFFEYFEIILFFYLSVFFRNSITLGSDKHAYLSSSATSFDCYNPEIVLI